jgi:hypothetical protein
MRSSRHIYKYFTQYLLLLICCTIAVNTKTHANIVHIEGNKFLYTLDEQDIIRAFQLLNFDTKPNENFKKSLLSHSENILLLSDGFESQKGSLANEIQKLIPDDVLIFKTGNDCPNPLDPHGKGNLGDDNIVNIKINNQRPLPFSENAFDTILMRKGLCHCSAHIQQYHHDKNNHKTCGGLRMNSNKDTKTLFSSVAKSINKKNPHSYAFLSGFHLGKKKYTLDIESESQKTFDQVIDEIKDSFPELDMRMMYMMYSQSNHLFNELVPISFIGIQMKVK